MVIGERFAWGHIGKTGGDAAAAYFAALGLNLEIDRADDIHKHDTFQYRGVVRDVYALNIRRLPHWVISYYNHHLLAPVAFDTMSSPSVAPGNPEFLLPKDKELFCSKMTNAEIDLSVTDLPDRMLKVYTDNDKYKIVWLRMECLVDDLIRFVNKYVRQLTEAEVAKLRKLSTKKPNDYNHDVRSWFTAEQVATLYKNNPYWTAIERRCYIPMI